MRETAMMISGIALLLGVTAMAQESRSEISLQGTGFYTKTTSNQSTTERSTDTGGFLIGYRYGLTRWLAAEAVYGYDRDTQRYFQLGGISRIQANIQQATGGFVVRLPAVRRFRISPYLLAEGGALVFDPTSSRFGTLPRARTQARGTFAYGGGADLPLLKFVALRAEYRGLVYDAPYFGLAALNTNSVTHTAQPSAGIVIRF